MAYDSMSNSSGEYDPDEFDLDDIVPATNEEVEWFEREYIKGLEDQTPTIEDYDFFDTQEGF